MEEVLSYPVTRILLSLCHIDSKMSKTTKSTLMKELQNSNILNNPEMAHAVRVKGMFFLDLLPELPEILGFVSRCILRKKG